MKQISAIESRKKQKIYCSLFMLRLVRIKRISIETKRNFPTTDTMEIGKNPLANSVLGIIFIAKRILIKQIPYMNVISDGDRKLIANNMMISKRKTIPIIIAC